MLVYHVVTDRDMAEGQRIIFDERNRSGVWQRVMARKDLVAEVYAHPERFPAPLEHHLDVAIRELAMEEVRAREFPHLPSRLAALYVSRTLGEAERWAEFFVRIGRPVFSIVEIRTDSECFVGDACNCFDGTPDHADNLARARRYWQNLPNEEGEPIWEMLAGGELTVVRIVRRIDRNIG